MMRTFAPVVLAGALLTASACGGSGDSSPAPTPVPTPTTTITVSASGAAPRNIVVSRGTQVTFVNADGSVHEMYSDPHPEHTDCPEFDSVGRLSPGTSRQTTNLVAIGTCRFHDHLNPDNAALKGSVTIQP
jgi:plastocyanin